MKRLCLVYVPLYYGIIYSEGLNMLSEKYAINT